jgi:glycosyltransferase involved in cell wall biosynthesis
MKVSIIMPAYNDEKLISIAVNSVLAQTHRDWELLIMDDGSTDKTSCMIDSFTDKRIRLFHQENKGQLVALNNLCPYITGDLVLMIHADDKLYCPETIQVNLENFKDPLVDGIYSDFCQFFDSGKPDKTIPVSKSLGKKAVNKLITRLGSNIIIDHFFVRRAVFEKQVKVNYLKWYMPYWLDFTKTKVTSLNLRYTGTPWYHYRVYDQNYTNSIIGNFEVYFTRVRTIFFLSDYLTVPVPFIQKEISRRLNLSGFVVNRRASGKHLGRCIKANIRSMRQRTPGAYTWYFCLLYKFYKTKSSESIRLKHPVKIQYTPAEARAFYNDLQNNTVAPVYSELIEHLAEGFKTILVTSGDEACSLNEIMKFLCIRADINIQKQ